ncbi:class I SAM-dependent methyltransferase [Pseudodesulfovibrio senegalensis]|jgi:ubiquinone/menaquinone biosynthesis C-methylase UbiE|nr:class I SAM-dependent methyltransferase [Pseudodesulfovibrio senegalensis]
MKDNDFYSKSWANDWSDMKRYSPIGRHTRRLIRKSLARCGRIGSLGDFGCGDGSLLQELSIATPGVELFGCDYASASVEQSRKRLPNAHIVEHDVTRAESPFGRRVDVGVTSEVLEHIEDHEAALRNMGSWCKRLIVTVPGGALDETSREMGHLRHYTKDSLKELAERAGLQCEEIREWGFPFAYPWYARMRNRAGYGAVTGQYSAGKKLLCHALYSLFFLNDFFDSGNKLVMLCRNPKA